MEYRGFVLGFYEYIPRMYAYNESLEVSFSIGMTEVQRGVYTKMYGEKESWKAVITNTMKRLINDYYESGSSIKRLVC